MVILINIYKNVKLFYKIYWLTAFLQQKLVAEKG